MGHVSDRDLVVYADGELAPTVAARVRAHVDKCRLCASRLDEVRGMAAGFGKEYREAVSPLLPNPGAARLSLQRQMASLEEQARPGVWPRLAASFAPARIRVGVVSLTVALLVVFGLYSISDRGGSYSTAEAGSEPVTRLTPGATVQVARAELCRNKSHASAVPLVLQQQVFARYGVVDPKPDAYEVDYLITPELGGATDIRNLWPEPYFNTAWNARVKDQLEDRLHQMVCSGELDLSTAQRDLAKDWIRAYRKYFRTEQPLSQPADSEKPDGDDDQEGRIAQTRAPADAVRGEDSVENAKRYRPNVQRLEDATVALPLLSPRT